MCDLSTISSTIDFNTLNGKNGTVFEYSDKSLKISTIIDLLSEVASFKQSSYINAKDFVSRGNLKSTPATYLLAFTIPNVSIIITFLFILLNCFERFLTIILLFFLSSILAIIFLSKADASTIILIPFLGVTPAITGFFALIELFNILKVNSFISESTEGRDLSYCCKSPSKRNKNFALAICLPAISLSCITCATYFLPESSICTKEDKNTLSSASNFINPSLTSIIFIKKILP